jgi:flagellar M-ring protein FliF
MPQRIILVAIILVAIVGIVALFRVSSAPSMVSVLTRPITDEAALDRISARIDQEDIEWNLTGDGRIQVKDRRTARRVKAILVSEDLIPTGIDPWNVFDQERWTTTDLERNVRLQRALVLEVKELIKALQDVDDAIVIIDFPKDELFRSNQKPVTASIRITPRPNSDITVNRKKIEGIQKLVQFAISGLTPENITITDNNALVLNDFTGMEALDRIELTKRENKVIADLENLYRKEILASLQGMYTAERVRQINIKFDMDMSKEEIDTLEHFPFTMKTPTPGLAYDDSILLESIPLSEKTTEITFEGSGFNPEGPAGVEGHTPPAFRDMDNLWGKSTSTERIHNEAINKRNSKKEKSPQIERVAVSVGIDGTWKMKYDEKGKPVVLSDGTIEREYFPIPADELQKARSLVMAAIGYKASRSDMVTVENIKYDRENQFREEDAAYFRKQQLQTMILIFLSGLTVLLIAFIVFRMVSREMERRRRLAEDERSRREQAIRESAIAQAEEDGVDVSISVEERSRMELLESVMNMAKEHPEDCAQLIRTWLLEE